MANISGYLANIKSASRGEDVRDSIINALNAINLDNPAVIKPLNVTANGTYAGQGGIVYNPVTVNVPEGTSNAIALKSIKITENGETEADDGEAFSSVEVDVPQYTNEILEEVTFTQNGDYDALLDGYDGYGLVHVNVQQGGTGSYTVKFFAADRTTVLQTVVGVPAGGGAAYTAGPNPTSSGMRFVGWTPNPLQIYADTNCYPRFENLIWDETQIQDDWITIAKNVRTNPDAYNIGQWKLLELNSWKYTGTETYDGDSKSIGVDHKVVLRMELVAKGMDPLEGENGYAPTTWISRNAFNLPNFEDTSYNGYAYAIDSRTSWRSCLIRAAFYSVFASVAFPQDLLPYVLRVLKYTRCYVADIANFIDDSTIDKFWIPSGRETNGKSASSFANIESQGPIYLQYDEDINKEYRKIYDDFYMSKQSYLYRTRTVNGWATNVRNSMLGYAASGTGGINTTSYGSINQAALGFCL